MGIAERSSLFRALRYFGRYFAAGRRAPRARQAPGPRAGAGCSVALRGANLRLADSSIMPQITNGNLNGPTLMIGEKASDHILGRDPLPPSNQRPWLHPDWETVQR